MAVGTQVRKLGVYVCGGGVSFFSHCVVNLKLIPDLLLPDYSLPDFPSSSVQVHCILAFANLWVLGL